MRVPIKNKDKQVVAWAVVDDERHDIAAMSWRLHSCGYAASQISRAAAREAGTTRFVLMHRLVLRSAKEVDHINGDRLDNRLCNLREVSHAANLSNRRGASKVSTTGLLGVGANPRSRSRPFRARVSKNGKELTGKVFATREEAFAHVLDIRKKHGIPTDALDASSPLGDTHD